MILQCEGTLKKCSDVVDALKVPMMIKNACLAKKDQGSVLEYGVFNHIERMEKHLADGIPGNPRCVPA
jgi:hypothetical protein